MKRTAQLLVMASAALGYACAGDVDAPGSSAEQGTNGTNTTNTGNVVLPPSDPEAAAYPPGTLHRLTVAQYRNSVRDLLGDAANVDVELEEDAANDGFVSIGAASFAMSRSAVESFERSAAAIARQVFTNPETQLATAGCDPGADADCFSRFITSFGRRAFRRPLTDEEVAAYLALANSVRDDSGDPWLGLEMTLAGLLQSPHFLYRVELGVLDPAGATDHLVLSHYELATRLSYVLLGTTPSEELLALADASQLGVEPAYTTQVQAMLGDARTGVALSDFFMEMAGLGDLVTLNKNQASFPDFNAELASAMDREVRWLFRTFAFERPGSILDIYDTRETFVDPSLATLYGFDIASEQALTHPDSGFRAGLLTSAGFLASHSFAERTSATARGKAIRQSLLCQSVPPPPDDVVPELPEPPSDQPQTARERLSGHSTNPSCAACHELMDPIGLGLENFDAIGRYREEDQGLPIDASGELDGVRFENPVELARAVKQHPQSASCVVRQLYRHVSGHREVAGEEPNIATLVEQFAASGHSFSSLALGLIQSPAFRWVTPAP